MLGKHSKKSIIMLLMICLIITAPGMVKMASVKSVTIRLPEGTMMTMKDDYTLETGVVETKLITNNLEKNARVISYAANIEMSDSVRIVANYGSYYSGTDEDKWSVRSWKRSRTTSQAGRYRKSTGNKVLVAINGDYFDMGNGKPKGALVINGIVYNEANNRPYFAIMSNGNARIFDAGSEIGYNVEQAVGGGMLLIKNGIITEEAEMAIGDLLPITSIGIKADGTVVMYEVDGRDEPYSVGMTISGQAKMLQGMGCVDALLLDAGGSSSFATTRDDDNEIVLRNNPSDGTERAVASTLMVILDAKAAEKNVSDDKTDNKAVNNKTGGKTTTAKSETGKSVEDEEAITVHSSSVGKAVEKTDSPSAKAKTVSYIVKGNGCYKITNKKKKQVCFVKLSNKNATTLSIPATIKYKGKTYKVVKIAAKACMNNKKLVKLTVSKRITNIGRKAFYGCTKLKIVSGIIL